VSASEDLIRAFSACFLETTFLPEALAQAEMDQMQRSSNTTLVPPQKFSDFLLGSPYRCMRQIVTLFAARPNGGKKSEDRSNVKESTHHCHTPLTFGSRN
jgi:hypothetical protein